MSKKAMSSILRESISTSIDASNSDSDDLGFAIYDSRARQAFAA